MTIPNYVQPNFDKDSDNSNFNLQQQQLIIELQRVLGEQKIQLPKVNETLITALNTVDNVGCILFNTTTNEFMGNKTGTFVNL